MYHEKWNHGNRPKRNQCNFEPKPLSAVHVVQDGFFRGAKLVIINLTETPHDTYADIVINEKTGETLFQIVAQVKKKLKG